MRFGFPYFSDVISSHYVRTGSAQKFIYSETCL